MLNILPKLINMMFKKNNEIHNYNTRRGNSLHTSVGKHENIYKCFSFHAINIWNYMIRYIPINIPYVIVFLPFYTLDITVFNLSLFPLYVYSFDDF